MFYLHADECVDALLNRRWRLAYGEREDAERKRDEEEE